MMFQGIRVGDKVAVSSHQGDAVWTVQKVGRKYFSAGRAEFRLDDGTSTSGFSTPRAFTLEAHARALHVAAAEKALRTIDVTIDYRAKDRSARILAVYEALAPLLAGPSESKADE